MPTILFAALLGGVLAVLPGQLSVAVWSPPLDEIGNSIRGIEVCRKIRALAEEDATWPRSFEVQVESYSAELHVYQNGGHGYGMRPVAGSEIGTWPQRAGEWLVRRNLARKSPSGH